MSLTQQGIPNFTTHNCFLNAIIGLFAYIENLTELVEHHINTPIKNNKKKSKVSVYDKNEEDFKRDFLYRQCLALYNLMSYYKPAAAGKNREICRDDVFVYFDYAFDRMQNYHKIDGDITTAFESIYQVIQKINPNFATVCIIIILFYDRY